MYGIIVEKETLNFKVVSSFWNTKFKRLLSDLQVWPKRDIRKGRIMKIFGIRSTITFDYEKAML